MARPESGKSGASRRKENGRMELIGFNRSHIRQAQILAEENYDAERGLVRALPQNPPMPDLAQFAEQIGFVGLDPKQFRRGKTRKNDIAGDGAEARIGVKLGCLGCGARVVPQDAGP